MRIVFFGTSDFAASILEHISKQISNTIVAVVTRPDRPIGRGQRVGVPPVKKCASTLFPDIPILQPERVSTPNVVDQLKELSPDLFLVVAFGEILKSEVLAIPRVGAFNIHVSLLPAYRGAAPIQWALMDGRSHTGVTIFRLDPKMDCGDVVWKKKCPIGENMNAGELTECLLEISKNGAEKLLHLALEGKLTFSPQSKQGVSKAPKIVPEDLVLNSSVDLRAIHNQIRAFSPKPGAYFLVAHQGEKKRLKILRSHLDGSVLASNREWIKTERGQLALGDPEGALIVDTLQLEGRKVMTSEDFLKGVVLQDLRFF